MIPARTPANGVPWLIWIDGWRYQCLSCGETGQLPETLVVARFAAALTQLKRRHHRCGGDALADRVGDPLNLGQVVD